MAIEIRNNAYFINGEEQFLISAEFPYFRVPREDWEKRLIQFKEMHGNSISSYVPWLIHEPEEGVFKWGDVGNRDICAFLELCQKLSLNVILRPGPMQYSELIYDGLPGWLFEKYPEVSLQRIDGSAIPFPSYMHPVFLEKARKYFASFADTVRPYLFSNGGPVTMIQVDNELMGCHIWRGTIDYNRQSCGFGRENGAYPKYLKAKYETVEALNQAYNSSFASFAEVFPEKHNGSDVCACRSTRDFFNFYLEQGGKYLRTLTSWLREDGITELVCHNSAGAGMTGLFDTMADNAPEGFLLASDNYYNLGQDWRQNNPTPQYALTILFSCEQLRNMGMPPTAMELPAGSCRDFPPILPEDLYACYATNVALGLKGLNFYIFTGGPNFEQTGNTCDTYDFNALIHADGQINSTYYAAQKFCHWLENHKWMQSAQRMTNVNVAYENELFRSEYFEYQGVKHSQYGNIRFIRNGMCYMLMTTGYSPALTDISRYVPDTDKPLILCTPTALSRKSQENVVEFLKRGGKLIVMPTLPELDENYNTCTILKDYIGLQEKDYDKLLTPPVVVDGCKEAVYYMFVKSYLEEDAGTVIGRNRDDGKAVLVQKQVGAGMVIFGTMSFVLSLHSQVDMMKALLERLGAKTVLRHSNKQIFASCFQGKEGKKAAFVMNLFSSSNTTDLILGDKKMENIHLDPMEVKILEL